MKKLLYFFFITITLLLFSTKSDAQDYAPIGAEWYYKKTNGIPNYETYAYYQSVKDTVINSQSCRKIVNNAETLFMYQNTNQEVYYYNVDSSRFCLIYDFSANKGDTIILDCYTSASTGKAMNIIVDSVDNVSINGNILKRQIVHDDDGLLYSFSGEIIERIGHTFFMFPTLTNNTIGPLRCYSDSVLGLYSTGISQFCNYTTGVNELAKFPIEAKFYPNPAKEFFYVEILNPEKEQITLTIHNLLGEKTQTQQFSASYLKEQINTRHLSKGIYVVSLQSASGKLLTQSKIVVQ